MKTLFGTDGIRGRVPEELNAEQAFRVGMAVAEQFGQNNEGKRMLVVGQDPRRSSDMLEAAVTAGICAAGADVERLGVIPTPAVALLTRLHGADAGMMISASHNKAIYNGIKCFDSYGYKLTDRQEAQVEEKLCQPRTVDRIGRVRRGKNPIQEYTDYLTGCVQGDLGSVRVLFDCANGAASVTIARLIRCLDLCADVLCCDPDGENINEQCGSTDLRLLRRVMQREKYDVGFAFDGDADRCVAVDEKGEELDGDCLLGLFAQQQKQRSPSQDMLVTTTVLSNRALEAFLNRQQISVAYTEVGDRQVMQAMRENHSLIGGEPSGHLIFREYGTTGDGQLTAIRLMEWMASCGKCASALRTQWTPRPQILQTVAVSSEYGKRAAVSEIVTRAVEEWETRMRGGRIVVRASGTEAAVRVMAEGDDAAMVQAAVEAICRIITQNEEDICQKTTGCTKDEKTRKE